MQTYSTTTHISAGVTRVDSRYTTVRTTHSYAVGSMVVIAAPITTIGSSVVAEVDNIGADSFALRVRTIDGGNVDGVEVAWLAVDAGIHDLGGDNRLVAQRVTLEVGGELEQQAGQRLEPGWRFVRPVVVGQIVSPQPEPATFWASSDVRAQPPNADSIRVGTATARAGVVPRTELCVVVMESGTHELNGVRFDARVTDPLRLGAGDAQTVNLGIEPVMAGVSVAGSATPGAMWATLAGQSAQTALRGRAASVALNAEPARDPDERERVAIVAINTDGDASRFAEQAGWGGTLDDLREIARLGYRDWLDLQRTQPVSTLLPYMEFIADAPFRNEASPPTFANAGGNNRWDHAQNLPTPWMRNLLWESDQLRQRVAFSLSQIFVVSGKGSELAVAGASLADYYDQLATHALGNYRDLMSAVTYHPVMAYYLTYVANRPPSADGTRQPDENYARELMQLFTIGLWELNNDGSLKAAADGEGFVQRNGDVGIPTYGNDEVNILARVFTGLFYDAGQPFGSTTRSDSFVNSYHWSGVPNNANDPTMYRRYPLAMFEEEHDHDVKVLFGQRIPATSGSGLTTIPSNRNQITDGGLRQIEDALDILFNHPNVGPFVARRLIQSLVTSNPSPGYIDRVATTFNDDGTGERGNLHAVVSQILLDPEARNYFPNDPARGKIAEPFVRIGLMAKAFRTAASTGRDLEDIDTPVYWKGALGNQLQQQILMSPSVFNFFSPDYELDEGVRAPEAEIISPLSIAAREKLTDDLLFHTDLPPEDRRRSYVQPEFDEELALVAEQSPQAREQLFDRLDVLLAHGQLTDAARRTLHAALDAAEADPFSTPRTRLKVVTVLTAMSADANVLL